MTWLNPGDMNANPKRAHRDRLLDYNANIFLKLNGSMPTSLVPQEEGKLK